MKIKSKKKKTVVMLTSLICLCLMTICGCEGTDSSVTQASMSEAESEPMPSSSPDIKDWKFTLPDASWTAKYAGSLKSWEMYKDGCYDDLNSTLSVFENNMNAEDSRLGSKAISDWGNIQMTDTEYEVNGVVCPAYTQYTEDYDKTVFKVFYPLGPSRSLQINIFVKKGTLQGVDPDSDEVKQIICNIINENDLGSEADQEEQLSPETIVITDTGLTSGGETYSRDSFTVTVPEGWNVFESAYGTTDLIKGGNDIDDYGSKPSVLIRDDDEDVRTAIVSNKKYYEDAADLNVNIGGTDYNAIQYTQSMASKDVYWTHIKLFLPVSSMETVSVDIITDTSKFDAPALTDDDIRQILVSIHMSI